MQKLEQVIRDVEGVNGVVTLTPGAETAEVRLESGERRTVSRALVTEGENGILFFRGAFSSRQEQNDGRPLTASVIEEQVEVTKRLVELERVRVTTSVTARDEVVDVPLFKEEITIERVPVGRVVQEAAPPRQEGNTMVVPVYEEVVVTEKRLVLREEIRITRVRREHHNPQHVQLRREDVNIERSSGDKKT